MTPEKAKVILKDAVTLFTLPANKDALMNAVNEANQAPEAERGQKKMQLLIPIVTGMVGPKLQEHGLPNIMMGVMQIQMVSGQDPLVAEGVKILTAATMGNPPSDAEVSAYLAKL